ncbi:MAG: fatty acid--CoA ligase [Spirosomataceae bacterium]
MAKIKKIASASKAFKYELLIKRILEYSLKLEPKREIHYRDQVKLNYIELNQRVRKLANVLNNLGADGGKTIAVLDFDSHRYLESFFAIPMTANVIHTINWRLSPEQILYTINHAEDEIIITHAEFVPLLNALADKMTTVKKIIIASDGKDLPESKIEVAGEYETLLAEASDEYEFEEFDEDAVATTFYTTGTTGNPKGVFFTHRQLVLHTMGLATTFGFIDRSGRLSNSDVYMPLTPFFHVHAWGFPFLATMMCMKQVYVGKFEPEVALKLFIQHNPTLSHCVPTILQMLVSHPATANIDLSNWKVIIGGSALPKALARAAVQRGVDIVTGYGMSETAPILTISYISPAEKSNPDLEWQVEARTRTGLPVPLVDLRIVDDEGNQVTADDEAMGEVVARTPWLTQGYFREEQQGENLWRDGWLHTGDVATINEKGFIKIADRIKDVIKTGGEWVSSIDLENMVGQYPAVAEVAVVGLPDAQWGERPHAMIVLKAGMSATIEDVKMFLSPFVEKGQITKWTIPDKILFVDALPKTSVGKIDKKVIRTMFG